MRQSPVLHSRIVQAYLDPNASQAQRQQQQHVSSENVRQAWLQDAHQENSEDDTEEEREQEHQHTSPIRPTVTRTPIPVYHHPIVPLPIQGTNKFLRPYSSHQSSPFPLLIVLNIAFL